MGPLRRSAGVWLLVVGLVGCGDDGSDDRRVELCMHVFDAGPEAGPEAGVAPGCGSRQLCDTSSVEPRCVCQDGYEGEGCTSCESGWRVEEVDGGVICHALPISCSTRPCGIGGDCVTIAGEDRCQCKRGYDGRLCSRCADGFQDNDGDGECEPGCRLAGLRCPGRRECSDLSGEPECVCIEGYAGESCDTCASGYRPTGAGGCLATCAVAELDCGPHGACSDLDGAPRCVCNVGYGGTGCLACAETHRDDGMGVCIADPPDGFGLLATATGERGEPILGALRPGSTELFGLTMLDRMVEEVAHDPASDRLYGLASGTLVEIDRRYGRVSELTSPPDIAPSGGLAWDPTRSVLYTVASDGQIVAIDPLTSTAEAVAASGFSTWEASLAYDGASDHVLGTSGTTSRFSVDLTTRSVTTFSPLGIDHPVERLAIAVEPTSGLPFAVADGTETATDALAGACREIAGALRYPIPGSLLVGGYGEPDPEMPGGPITLTYEGVDPPLVVYGSYGDRSAAPRELRVSTQHPDAVVCVITYEEVLHVVVDATARFHYLVLVSHEPTLTLQIEEGFTPKIEGVPPIRVRVSSEPPDPSLLAPEELVRFYDAGDWAELALTTDIWSSSTRRLPVLVAIDWSTGAVFERSIDARSFSGGLTPFGAAP